MFTSTRILPITLLTILFVPTTLFAQSPQPSENYERGKVVRIQHEFTEEHAGIERRVQNAEIEILSGPDTGERIMIENGIVDDRPDMRLTEGETIVLQKLIKQNGSFQYLIRDKYRIPSLILLTLFFVALGVLFGGKTGVSSLLGLAFSVLVLTFFVVPRIIAGDNPLLISLTGSFFIASISLYLAHGFNKRTSIALVSTVLSLILSTIMAIVFVEVAQLFGMGTEEAVFLQVGSISHVNLKGLLLGGIIIGALGVLDDITTSQTAAIHEISKANPKLTAAELYKSGVSIGREHIASLMNTLALAYVGASLPLLLLFSTQRDMPVWAILNTEFMAEEIVRTLVGSATLIIAVPISTYFAAKCFEKGRGKKIAGEGGGCGHVHAHT